MEGEEEDEKTRKGGEETRVTRERVRNRVSREIQRARDAATRACDDALAAVRVAFAEKHRLESASSESEEESPDAEALAEELAAAAAAAARAALAAAAAVSVPEDKPSGATPTRATATALAPPTPRTRALDRARPSRMAFRRARDGVAGAIRGRGGDARDAREDVEPARAPSATWGRTSRRQRDERLSVFF